jgi:formylglycine-generating enzyme required for sulfatase activity
MCLLNFNYHRLIIFSFTIFSFLNSVTSQTRPNIEWVEIPKGSFKMGSPEGETNRKGDEQPHEVALTAFKMSKYEITFEQYDLFCTATNRAKPNDEGWGRGNRPVINVSWHDANAFAEWMHCRLPTEAEWEYAARAGSTTPFNTGFILNSADANYDGNFPYIGSAKGDYLQQTSPVGSFPPNQWGLHDMHGNVWEWCSDWYGDYLSDPQMNPTGLKSGYFRVQRGGSWFNGATICRSASRSSCYPGRRDFNFGFRIVSSID